MAHRYVFGLLAPRCTGSARKLWNALVREQGIDAFFDFYPAKTVRDLELRLAEMFHLGRRAYTVGESLQTLVLPLLDRLDPGVREEGRADTVLNEGGVLTGVLLGGLPPREQLSVWMRRTDGEGSD